MRLAIIGAGWAGLAAAVEGVRAGHTVTVFEAAGMAGGRARTVAGHGPGHGHGHGHGDVLPPLDNGQHILIGAYTETLRLMALVGVAERDVLLRMPLSLRFPDGRGLALPKAPSPLDLLLGIVVARGWSVGDKWSLLRTAGCWQKRGFRCAPQQTVAGLCASLAPRVMQELIEPLCVSALNTPARAASGQVFLRVLQDALFGVPGSSHLLLPRTDLGALFPVPAQRWLAARDMPVQLHWRVQAIARSGDGWTVDAEPFDRVLLACPPGEAARLAEAAAPEASADWCAQARALRFEAITTVYAHAATGLAEPMLPLRSNAAAPAQFVFDRGQLGGPQGLLAFVVSASHGERAALEQAVVQQAQAQLNMAVVPLQTIVEKRATFACTPGLSRPPQRVAPGLLACGDYLDGPYPATLEGAVRSGIAAIPALSNL